MKIEKVEIVVTFAGDGPAEGRRQAVAYMSPEKLAELQSADRGIVGAVLRGELATISRAK